jgi:hypothetical protein
VFLSLLIPCIAHAALSSGCILRRGVWANVGWKQCCRIDWFGVEHLHVHDLVRSYIISIVVVLSCSACTIHFLIVHLITSVLFRYLGGKKVFLAVPYQVKACVFSGLLYAIVGTLPSLIMKYELPCSKCNTEEWYARSSLHSAWL